MQPEVFTEPFFIFFEELFGTSDSPSGYFLDNGQSGILGTIDRLTAAQASAGGESGQATIAAHCCHILLLLDIFISEEKGEPIRPDWKGSWAVNTVDEASWGSLRTAIRTAYDGIVVRLKAPHPRLDEVVDSMILVLVYCAYHLGEIRQRLNWIDRA
jgi:hypothetical protein